MLSYAIQGCAYLQMFWCRRSQSHWVEQLVGVSTTINLYSNHD
jgi:hypothetical protein